jgi:hypothetical protein
MRVGRTVPSLRRVERRGASGGLTHPCAWWSSTCPRVSMLPSPSNLPVLTSANTPDDVLDIRALYFEFGGSDPCPIRYVVLAGWHQVPLSLCQRLYECLFFLDFPLGREAHQECQTRRDSHQEPQDEQAILGA